MSFTSSEIRWHPMPLEASPIAPAEELAVEAIREADAYRLLARAACTALFEQRVKHERLRERYYDLLEQRRAGRDPETPETPT